MRTLFIAGVALLSSCWGTSCPGWDATPKVSFERMAAARLQQCVQGKPCANIHQCFLDSNAYCLDAGYAKECGQAEVEGSCGTKAPGGI